MVTMVGTQTEFLDALKELVELDYDAIEAYKVAIERLERSDYKSKLEEFKSDHERHIRELSELLTRHSETAPSGPSAVKQWLTKGKVAISTLMGDMAILKAMKTNEDDTNTAYEKMLNRNDVWPDAKDILERGYQDEKKHKQWLETTEI